MSRIVDELIHMEKTITNFRGDSVSPAINFNAYDQREKQLELREKLIEVEELRNLGVQDISAKSASMSLRERVLLFYRL